MESDMAKIVVKAREPYECLDDVERIQLEAFVQQRIQIAFRGFRASEKSAFLIGAKELRGRFKINTREFSSSNGARECYEACSKEITPKMIHFFAKLSMV